MRAIFRTLGSAMLLFAVLHGTALAQAYPSRPVTFIVPWPPGGSTDLSMRAEVLSVHAGAATQFR